MLFVLIKTRSEVFEGKTVLLVGDAAYYAAPFMSARFQEAGVEEIYVARDALEARRLELHPDAQVVDYDEMAALIMDEEDKVLCI
jgi:sulfur relay protein TusB/DsrH